MNTTAINATYRLPDDVYRARVAEATGPVGRSFSVHILVEALTAEARLALLDVGLATQECPTVHTGDRATAPTAADVSACLLVLRDAVLAREANAREALADNKAAQEARDRERIAAIGAWLDRLEIDPTPAIRGGRWVETCLDHGVHGDGAGCPDTYRQRLAALRARVEADLAAKAEAEAKRLAGLELEARAWAAEHGARLSAELARAAREGRTVLPEIQRLVYDGGIEEVLVSLTTGPCGVLVYGEEVRDDVPTAAAYALSDMLAAAAPAIAAAGVIPHVGIEIGPISRFDVAPRGDEVWRTGVRVSASHPWLAYPETRLGPSWVLLSEPIDPNGDD